MSVSIIIPSFNRPKLLNLGLFSLFLQVGIQHAEIVVINDGIDDETENVCLNYADRLNIKYIFSGKRNWPNPISRIPGFAINIGVKQCKGDIIILTNPEIFHLDIMNLSNLVNPFLDPLRKEDKIITKLKGIHFDLQFDVKYDDHSVYASTLPFFIGLKKKYFMEIGGYDEDFTGYACDDDDFVGRLAVYGLEYLQFPGQALHLYHGYRELDSVRNSAEWKYNYQLFIERKGIVKRNLNREWGING